MAMQASYKMNTVIQPVKDPADMCQGQTRSRVAEVLSADMNPLWDTMRNGLHQSGVKVSGSECRLVLYEKREHVGIITARVLNVGEVYDEIDSLLDEIERDEDVQRVAIFTPNGLFALFPIR
jgi:hypothetical protein